ncbi:MAG: DNA-processing protein DprA [Anaerolineae bacterium]|jgi:DNA processing protein
MTDERAYWLGFNLVPQIGPARFDLLRSHFQSAGAAWHASAAVLRGVGLPKDAIELLLYHRQRLDLTAELQRLDQEGVRMLTLEEDDYPKLLRSIDLPPPVLYVRGELTPADEFAVAVVGTRHATVYGKEITQRLAGGLAENGVTIVSGLALGIDAVAHQAALDVGGRTLAVQGCGLDRVYPARHHALAKAITSTGALLSTYPLGTKVDAVNFPPRNRVISGLSLGVIIVEAGERSGALITLHYALDQGRETFAVPGNILSRASFGANRAIQRGEAKLITSVQDVLDELNLTMIAEQQTVREHVPDSAEESLVLGCLTVEPLHIDDIVRQTQLPAAVVSSTLLMLELKGAARRADHASYVLTR